ncbi:MAG: tetratricopeptide repeat protein [Desulfobacteraceae bacterium]|nr:tetratricopeptide repeat protein [Desulfobacteraceae bacterium]
MRCTMSDIRSRLLLALVLVCWVGTGPPVPAETLREKLFSVPSNRIGPVDEPDLKPLGEEIPDWKARWELARLLSYTGKYMEAIKAYRRVLSEKPELIGARIELARVLYWNDESKEALENLSMVPDEELQDTDRILLGDLFAFQKQYGRAVTQYQHVLEAQPGRTDVRFRLAEVYTWADRFDSALEAYRQVLKGDPDNIQARRKYAQVLAWTGDREEAIRQLEQTLP